MQKLLVTVVTVMVLAPALPAMAENHGEPSKPNIAFAERVVELSVGSPKPSKRGFFPDGALGTPDWNGDNDSPTYTTLGCGGVLVIQFSGAGGVDRKGADFRVYEIGNNVEGYSVEISRDLKVWYHLGKSGGGTGDFDIAAGAPTDHTYKFLRITDAREKCKGRWPGADIDAVAALHSGIASRPEAVLAFLREVEGRLLPVGDNSVAYGEAFVIELRFGQAQAESQLTVNLEWEEGRQNIEMLRAGESRILYRSGTLRLDYRNGAARLVKGDVQP